MTASAQRQARAERRWWRANRDAKHVFSQELRAARQVLARGPKLEIYGSFDEGAARATSVMATQHPTLRRAGVVGDR